MEKILERIVCGGSVSNSNMAKPSQSNEPTTGITYGVVRMDQCALVLVHNGGVRTVENNNILDAPLLRDKREFI
jgi:hypothetical protein